MAPSISAGDIVLVTNVGDRPVSVQYDSRTYRLEPSKTTPMPLECAILWFGDPRASDALQSVVDERGIRSYIPDRESEVRRLRVKYDNQLGDERVIVNYPLVKITDLNGEVITTVLDDPSGDAVINATQSIAQQNDLMSIIQKQGQQIALLTQLVQANQTPQTGLEPNAPGFVQDETGQDATRTEAEQTGPTAVPAPQIPGVPSTPVPPLPEEVAANVVENIPQDGETVDVSEMPQDGSDTFTPTPPSEVPPTHEA